MGSILLLITFLAQGSGSTAPGASSSGFEDRPFVVTRSVDATLVEITKSIIVVKEIAKNGKEKIYEVRLDPKMLLSADKKTTLGQEKRRIGLEDFKPGQFVRLTWNPDTGTVVALRAIPEKAAKTA